MNRFLLRPGPSGCLAAGLVGMATLMGSAASAEPELAFRRAIVEAEAGLRSQELQIAESRFRSALYEGWLLLGSLDAVEGRLEPAKESFERASSSAAETRRARVAVSLVHLRLGEYEAAISRLRQLVTERPDDARYRRLLAQALVAAERPEEAVQELEEAHEKLPGDMELAFALATGYLRVGELERAESLFAVVEEERPIAQTQVLIGRTYREFREFDRSRRALEKAIEMAPETPRVRYYLGTLELLEHGRDRLPAAIDWFARELEVSPDDPTTNLYHGMALVEERRCPEASESLEVARRFGPTRLDALRFQGRCRMEEGHLEEAVVALRESLELARVEGARDRQLSNIHYQLATALRRLGENEAAERHFAAAEEISADLVESYKDRLRQTVEDTIVVESTFDIFLPAIGDPRVLDLAAEQRTELRQRVAGEMARVYLNLGVLQVRASHPSRAALLLSSAAELDPGLPRVHYTLGTALFDAGDFVGAVEALERARRDEPADPQLLRMLALARLSSEDFAGAAELLAADPERDRDPELQYAYALALVRSGRTEEASRAFERLLAEQGDWPALRVLVGQAQAQEDDFEAAVASLRRALELDPEVAEANGTLGDIYFRQGRLDEAEAALEAELRHHPRDHRSRYRLAVVLDLNRKAPRAIEELERVLAVQPDFADARYLLGKIRLSEGEVEEAVHQLESAVALAPEDANVRYQLAQAYRRSGRTSLAESELEVYRELKRRERESSP